MIDRTVKGLGQVTAELLESAVALQRISDAVKECVLLTFGYRFTCGEDGDDIRFQAQTNDGAWRSQFVVNEAARLVRLYVFLTDDGYSPSLQPRVAELVHRLNEDIILGHYGYEWDTGGVSFHLVEDYRDRVCSSLDVERMMNTLGFPLQLWQLSFGKLKKPHVKPVDAFNAAMIEADAAEEDADVSKGTRKALLTLM